MGDGVLVSAVVVHHPDLFVATAEFDVEDLRLRDADGSSPEAEDNLVGEAMSDLPRGVFAGLLVVLLCEDLRELRVAHIVEEAVDDETVALHAEVAEGDHLRAGRSGGPLAEAHLAGRARRCRRYQALGDEIEDACGAQVIEQDGIEGVLVCRRVGVSAGAFEVGCSQADAARAGAGDDLEGTLRQRRRGSENGECQCCEACPPTRETQCHQKSHAPVMVDASGRWISYP
jgi:hypothetical protein